MRARRRRALLFDTAIGAVLAAVALTAVSQGHSPANAYPNQWIRDTTLEFKFHREFPRGKFRVRVLDAAQRWNELHEPVRFVEDDGAAAADPAHECGDRYQDNVISYHELRGTMLGLTTYCVFPGSREMYSFQIAFDRGRRWSAGKRPPKRNEYDLYSVATHELGHAAGRSGHFGQGSSECRKRPKHTLCPLIYKGEPDARHPRAHDRHTFKKAY